MSQETYEHLTARCKPERGDVLYTAVGSYGIAIAVDTDRPFVFQRHIAHIKPEHSVVDAEFLAASLNAPPLRAHADSVARGVAQKTVTLGELSAFPVSLPPLNEQRRIVAKLKSFQARSRRAREALDEVPGLLEKLRQSILAAAFRGDLTKDWRAKNPDVEPADRLLQRIRAERRKKWEESELSRLLAKGKPPRDDRWKEKYREPEPADAANLATLPSGWCWASLDELTFLVGGITKGQQRKDTAVLRSVPYLRVANVQRGSLDLSEVKEIEATDVEIEDLRLLPGDILLNEGGDRDKLGRGWIWEGQLQECIHQNHVFRARPVSATIRPELISHYANLFGQIFFVDQGKQTTNLASVSMSRVRRLPVVLPPSAEQQQMLERIRHQLEATARIIEKLGTARNDLSNLDRTILSKAFRGELVPQDSADEPAAAMLARLGGAAAPSTDSPPSPPPGKRRGHPRKS